MHAAPPSPPVSLAPAAPRTQRRQDGGWVLQAGEDLHPHAATMVAKLLHWAAEAPTRVFLAERDPHGAWRRLTYSEAAGLSARIAQALIDRGLSAERPVMVLSENGIDHALLLLGAMQAGIPLAPISPAYSLMSADKGKLKHIFALLRPGLVYASDGTRFGAALASLPLDGVEIVVSANPPAGLDAQLFGELTASPAGPAVTQARDRITAATVVKILFTSGSTGLPKGVINTQRMMTSNQQSILQLWRFLGEAPPVLVDWLPWNHTAGGNHNFNLILWNGGTLYIDEGKPVPGLIEKTVRNLAEISPTVYFSVPRGYDILLPYLERDEALCRRFFAELAVLQYAGAALPHHLWERIEHVIARTGLRRPLLAAGWGSTETAPMATLGHFPIAHAHNIGLPGPGTMLKLAPVAGKFELRVKGPNVTPGYWRDPAQTRSAFDEEGYLRMGDAGRLADPEDPAQGVIFEGRIGENFKLSTGTWVEVGRLRVSLIAACAPLIQDAVITGHDGPEIGVLAFPNVAACRGLCASLDANAPVTEVIRHRAVLDRLGELLTTWNAANPASTTRVARVVLLSEPPSIDANEITDKGYLNQRAVRDRRANDVARLHAEIPDLEVIVLSHSSRKAAG